MSKPMKMVKRVEDISF